MLFKPLLPPLVSKYSEMVRGFLFRRLWSGTVVTVLTYRFSRQRQRCHLQICQLLSEARELCMGKMCTSWAFLTAY